MGKYPNGYRFPADVETGSVQWESTGNCDSPQGETEAIGRVD
jgi:hypothetical protein